MCIAQRSGVHIRSERSLGLGLLAVVSNLDSSINYQLHLQLVFLFTNTTKGGSVYNHFPQI